MLDDNSDLDPQMMEATGLAPGASDVTDIAPHDTDPAYSVVTYADGRNETMPTSQAKLLPMAPMGPPALEGPPPPPVGPGGNPDDAALTSVGDPLAQAPTEGQLVSGVQGAANGPGAGFQDLGVRMAPGAGPGTLPDAQPDPNAPVAPGDVAQPLGNDTITDTVSGTVNNTVGDPEQVAQDVSAGYSSAADDLDAQARGEQVARNVENQALLEQENAHKAQLEDDLHKAQIHTEESKKVVDAIEATPIEEDFYKDAPGRQVAAWVALALSGFLSGSTQGANPAMGQMMQALSNAQNRFIDNQRADKSSKLAKRTKLLGDAQAAEATLRMQYGKVVDDHAKTVAKQYGLDALPPAMSTAAAKLRVEGAEAAGKVQMFVQSRTEQRHAVERKPPTTQAPTNQAEAQLQTFLGPQYAKKHAEATDPKGTNLPGILVGAQRAEEIKAKLDKLAKDNGGQLPGEGITGGLGASTSAKVFGDQASKNVLEAKSLKEELKLAFKQSSTTSKYFDSEKEGQGLNDILNTGNWETSSKAIGSYAQRAKQAALSIADGVAPGRGKQYLDYLSGASKERPTMSGGGGGGGIRERVVQPAPAGGTTGEAPATRPLPPPAGKAPEANPGTGSQRGTYRRLRESKPDEPR